MPTIRKIKRFCHWKYEFCTNVGMANIANFVSVLLANASKSILFFICLISVTNLISNCAADKTNNDIRRTLKEFQNGKDNIEIFADNGIKTSRRTFGQLKNRVVISNGETILGRTGKICLSITFYLSIKDWRFKFSYSYDFSYTYNFSW